ncbi:sn-glycerol-1-phosphate dehydrogenase [Paenibacillus sp. CF384]|uniref:sn-glycerol-1-phosphate dehydrogenase n=1 Tax=Paenibacillus sp. CF384 TaxID=1884382 RepID=UPI000896C171|nr:sn-glycerol-1-phosphate dehydrogenase [Paenibacillus sp. CF384]SDW80627.1 glycerol-1-phosphate dehydrogenase [NAD(P)+] [Paenibacillus sp. CF384]
MNIQLALDEVNAAAREKSEGVVFAPIEMAGVLDSGALREVAPFVRERGYGEVVLVVDANTWDAAGKELAAHLEGAGVAFRVCELKPNAQGDVIADERTIVQLMLETPPHVKAVLAVGSGTIHDIVRFVCYQTGRDFVSVPTAASVDGFTSVGAPIIVDGVKITVPAVAPCAVFADLHVLAAAPQRLTAAGFADMLGKFTSLADWRFSHELAGEPFCPLAYELTEQALMTCIANVNEIATGSLSGVGVLMEALLLSGWSMLLVGHSRPASGGEHHLSHHFEMAYIREGRRQLLHGAKVGVASVLLAELYGEQLAAEYPAIYGSLPHADQLRDWLRAAGGPSDPAEIGLSDALIAEAMQEAHKLRDRYTGLKHLVLRERS